MSSAGVKEPFPASKVAIVIKCLNEEEHIDAAIRSSKMAAEMVDGIVVVSDSGSTDRTIEIALAHDVNVVQLKDRSEASCGVGAQLGFQFTNSEYVYMMDGDMELDPAFLPHALARMEQDPALAGVGGIFLEDGGDSYEYQRRRASGETVVSGDRPSLSGGGLYRVAHLQGEYLTNPILHACEEAELGLRLRLRGFRLERLSVLSVRHHGHSASTGKLLMMRWKRRYLDGPGEWMASHGFKPGLIEIILSFKQFVAVALSQVFSLVMLVASLFYPPLFWVALAPLVLIFVWFLWRRRSIGGAWDGFLNMEVRALGLIRGLFRARPRRSHWVEATILKRAGGSAQ